MFITKKQIRKELYKCLTPEPVERLEEVYTWITNAPFWQWKDRLWCATLRSYVVKENYEEAYNFITRKTPR